MERLRPKLGFLVWTAGIVLLSLIILQGFLLNLGIDFQRARFEKSIPAIMLEIHHSIEDDYDLSNDLISYLQLSLEGEIPEISLKEKIVHTITENIDSIGENRGIGLSFDFVIYERKSHEVFLKSNDSIAFKKEFLHQSQRAGWRVKKAFGGNKFRIGLDYKNEYSFLLGQLRPLIFLSFALIILMITIYSLTVFGWNEQRYLGKLKNDFINNLTHELSTPIFSIELLHSMIRKEVKTTDSASLDKYLNLLAKENSKLKTKLESVMQTVLLDGKVNELRYTKANIFELIKQSCEMLELVAEEKGGKITYVFDGAQCEYKMDLIHFEGVIQNLVENAIKYSEGAPFVLIDAQHKNGKLFIQIEDKGIGIKKENHHRVFEKFYRANDGDLHEVKGMGLGLYYVRSVVEAHGGNIKLESEPGIGSKFIIDLPYLR